MGQMYKKVLANMYLLVSGGLVLAALSAWFSVESNLIDSGLKILGVLIAAIVLVIAASAKADSATGLWLSLLFFMTMGLLISPAVGVAPLETIVTAITGTALIFLALSVYALVSKKDFTFMGGFLFIALVGIIILGIINIFAQIPMLHIVISYAALLIFSLFVLHDTSEVVTGKETNYIRAALNMFLNIINIFTSLLSICGDD